MTSDRPLPIQLSRRQLLSSSALLVTLASLPPRAVAASTRKTLVCICLRGGLDGLSALVPYGDSRYYDARPSVAIPEPGKPFGCIPIDEHFGLHPSLDGLLPLYRSGRLALVHAAGSPHVTRSHFEAQDYLETGVPGNAVMDGWLNRYLAMTPERERPLRAVAISGAVPRALHGPAPVIAMVDPSVLKVQRGDGSAAAALQQLYANRRDGFSRVAQSTLSTIDEVQRRAGGPYTPARGARYPADNQSLMQVARLLKAGFDVEVAWLDLGGWDSHTGQRGSSSALARSLRKLGDTLTAFYTDMGKAMRNIVVVVMTEFGRTVAENGTGGTDHGHGGVLFVLGGPVRGGKVHGEWPGLAKKDLFFGRDLEVTTDYRRVLGDVTQDYLGLNNLEQVFPDYGHRRLGLFEDSGRRHKGAEPATRTSKRIRRCRSRRGS